MKAKIGKIFMVMGITGIILALGLWTFNLYSSENAGIDLENVSSQIETYRMSEVEASELSEEIMTEVEIDGEYYIGNLRIPSIDLDLPVISSWSNDSLEIAPSRFSGSVYKDNLVICGHNYKRHFSNLRSVVEGDEVLFTDMNGTEYRYEVVLVEVLEPDQVKEMKSSDYELTLFTCTWSGKARLAVRCKKIED